jgi:hypothetical protein
MGRPRTRAGQAPRRQGALETNLCRKGIYGSDGAQLSLPINSQDLLGAVRTSGRLRIDPDLDLLIWLTERWRELRPERGDVEFTLYEVAQDLYGHALSGADRRRLREALLRLRTTAVDLIGYHSVTGETGGHVSSWETLLDRYASRLDDVDVGADGAGAGSLRGTTFTVRLPDWMTASIAAGHVTFIRFAVLRKLSELAKRLWVYLEAERYRPHGAGQEATWIKLGDRAYTTLGMNYAQERFARVALRRAASKVLEIDGDVYLSIAVEPAPLGGWRILAVRRTAEGRRARRKIVESLLH